MQKVEIFNTNQPDIDLYVRRTTEGKENNLVQSFVDYYIYNFKRRNKVKKLAVFIEPRVESGFPDIVFVKYHPNIVDNWSEARMRLVTSDLKLLSQLIYSHGCTKEYLMKCLKISEEQTLTSLEKLMDAQMIVNKNGIWRSKSLKNIYHIEKLISVEAKLDDMKKVLEQSLINTWFASQSYVLTDTMTPRKKTISSVQNYGIGLYCKQQNFKKIVEAKKMVSPLSYLSLQFNEWIGNAIV